MHSTTRTASMGLLAIAAAALLSSCGREAPASLNPDPVVAPPPATAAASAAVTSPVQMDRVAFDHLSFDLPLYPGAAVESGMASRIAVPTGTTWMVTLRSADPSHQLLGFYREAMQKRAALAASTEFAEFGGADDGGTTLVLADPAAGLAVQMQVSSQGDGSVAEIVDTRALR